MRYTLLAVLLLACSEQFFSSIRYGDGSLNVSLTESGCAFGLSYPGVATGSGSCEVD